MKRLATFSLIAVLFLAGETTFAAAGIQTSYRGDQAQATAKLRLQVKKIRDTLRTVSTLSDEENGGKPLSIAGIRSYFMNKLGISMADAQTLFSILFQGMQTGYDWSSHDDMPEQLHNQIITFLQKLRRHP